MVIKLVLAVLAFVGQFALGADPNAFEIHAVASTASASTKVYPLARPASEIQTMVLYQKVLLDGSAIKAATLEFRPNTSFLVIAVTLTKEGTAQFGKITTEYVGKQLAFVVAGKIEMAPMVAEPLLSPNFQIDGTRSFKEASDLVLLLNKQSRQ